MSRYIVKCTCGYGLVMYGRKAIVQNSNGVVKFGGTEQEAERWLRLRMRRPVHEQLRK